MVNMGMDNASLVKRALGDAYRDLHEDTLHYIPANQLSLEKALGTGSFGSVVQATWLRPAGVNRPVPVELPVAVKMLHVAPDNRHLTQFVQEVSVSSDQTQSDIVFAAT